MIVVAVVIGLAFLAIARRAAEEVVVREYDVWAPKVAMFIAHAALRVTPRFRRRLLEEMALGDLEHEQLVEGRAGVVVAIGVLATALRERAFWLRRRVVTGARRRPARVAAYVRLRIALRGLQDFDKPMPIERLRRIAIDLATYYDYDCCEFLESRSPDEERARDALHYLRAEPASYAVELYATRYLAALDGRLHA